MEFEKGLKSQTEIAKQFGVPKNAFSGSVKKADTIKQGYLKFGPKRRNVRTGSFDDLETALLKWFTSVRDRNIPISGPLLLEKAKFFADQLGITDFKHSTGWLDRFKERHGLKFKKVCGESKSVDSNSEAMTQWSQTLANLLDSFAPGDIYNADETAIFFRLMPEKTLEFKSVNCQGGKASKERLTALVCSNMTGTDKIPLLIVEKSSKPRCFKNVKTLPTPYEANKKAWMTSSMFTAWLLKLDKKMQKQKRNIAMIVDNCPAHPHEVKELKAIKLVYLPPNTTSHTQPMDQGIIRNLKCHYRNQVVMKQLDATDKGETFTVSVLDALYMLDQAWSMVTPTTIENCYRHARFIQSTTNAPLIDDTGDDDDDNMPLARLAQLKKIDIESYVDVDKDVSTCETLTDADIVNEMIQSRDGTKQDSDDEDEPTPLPPPTISQAMDAVNLLRRMFESKEDTGRELSALRSMDKVLIKLNFDRRCLNAKQSEITDFLNDRII